jgi:hypothetical protein
VQKTGSPAQITGQPNRCSYFCGARCSPPLPMTTVRQPPLRRTVDNSRPELGHRCRHSADNSHGAEREAPGVVGGKPTRTGGARRRRSGSGAAALPGVTTCGRPHSYGLRQVDVEAATIPTKPAEPSAPSMAPSSSSSAAVNTRQREPSGCWGRGVGSVTEFGRGADGG